MKACNGLDHAILIRGVDQAAAAAHRLRAPHLRKSRAVHQHRQCASAGLPCPRAASDSHSDLGDQLDSVPNSQSSQQAGESKPSQHEQVFVGQPPDPPNAPRLPKLSNAAAVGVGVLAASGALLALLGWSRRNQARQHAPREAAPAAAVTTGQTSTSTERRRERRAKRRKEVVCRNFAANGTCRFGDRCRYSHDINPADSRPMQTASPLTTDDVSDSGTDSETDEAVPVSSKPTRQSASSHVQTPTKGKPAPELPVRTEFQVPAEKVSNIGKLMGYGGKRINQVTKETGCRIVVPKTRQADAAVTIEIYAEDEAAAAKAYKIVEECLADPA